jgi:hypothetical protein
LVCEDVSVSWGGGAASGLAMAEDLVGDDDSDKAEQGCHDDNA